MSFNPPQPPGARARLRESTHQAAGLDVRRMQLQAALAAGGSASAQFVLWNATDSKYEAGGDSQTVYSYGSASGSTGDYLDAAYRRDSGRWEALDGGGGGAWLGVLAGALSYRGSATVNLYSFDAGLGYFTSSGQTDTCYSWLMLSGDSIPAGTQVVGCYVGGKRVVFDAACNTGT